MYYSHHPYQYSPKEVVLLESRASFHIPDDEEFQAAGKTLRFDVLLTNEAIVLTAAYRQGWFGDSELICGQIGLEEILRKDKSSSPLIERKENLVRIQCVAEQVDLRFDSETSARRFVQLIFDQLTGTTEWQRNLESASVTAINVLGQLASSARHVIRQVSQEIAEQNRKSASKDGSPLNSHTRTSGAAWTNTKDSLQESLDSLEQLRKSGILSEEEYRQKRDQLLSR